VPSPTASAFPPTEPIPVHRGSPSLRDSFSSLQVLNYRRFQASQLLAHTAGWMQRIATDWLVLEITGNIAAVGLTIFLQWGPMLLLGPYGAVIADRFSKRKLLMGVYAVFGVLSALLAALALTGVVELWHVYVISVLIGLVFVVESPARVVLVSEMVEPRLLQNAISLNASVFRVVGESLKQQRILPKYQDIITSGDMEASIADSVTQKTIQLFVGVRCAGHSFDVTARGIVSENVPFVAISVTDELENP
jgi:hypothetical protein